MPELHEELQPYGWNDRWRACFADAAVPGAVPARVVRHDGTAVLVFGPEGLTQVAVRPSDPPLAVGDWVAVKGGDLAAILPRASLLQRRDPSGGEQLLAANVDLVLVVCGLDRPVRAGRLQRTAVLAWDAGADPVVVLAKVDLVDDPAGHVAAAREANPSVDVVTVSVRTGAGLEEVERLVRDRTVVLTGESGAGKSSLLNALHGDDVAATGKVRAGDSKGRHTTTSRHLHLLPGGGCVIDSPGVREVGLPATAGAVDEAFGDVMELAEDCRFRDCAHDGEPGCAVTAAVADGTLPAARLEAWMRLRREAEAAELRADAQRQRKEGKRFARVAKEAQRRKGRG